jgi:hypothetical protein
MIEPEDQIENLDTGIGVTPEIGNRKYKNADHRDNVEITCDLDVLYLIMARCDLPDTW